MRYFSHGERKYIPMEYKPNNKKPRGHSGDGTPKYPADRNFTPTHNRRARGDKPADRHEGGDRPYVKKSYGDKPYEKKAYDDNFLHL